MPYYITDKSPDCPAWAVIKADGEVIGCHNTKESAIKQAVAISIDENEPFVGERAAVGSLEVGDYVTWSPLDPKVLGEVMMVNGQFAGVKIYEYEDGIFYDSDKIMVLNVFRLEKIRRPEKVAEKMPDEEMPLDESPRNLDGESIIIADLDDTLINSSGRIEKVWNYIQDLSGALFIITGRPESQKDETIKELADNEITYSRLIMNPGSTADSPDFKKATAEALLETYNIILAIDNNAETLANYRDLGIEAISPRDIPDQPNSEDRAINQEPPAYMRAAARRGLQYYEQGLAGDGVTAQTVREAREMASGQVSDDKWIRIAAWIARHLPDLDAPDADPQSDNYPSAGVVAHLLWGSGPSKRAALRTKDYADSVVARIRQEETNSMDKTNKWLDVAIAIQQKIDGTRNESKEPEVRVNHTNFEIRQDEGNGMTFTGYAAVFNSPSEDLGGFVEYVAPGAFKRSLQARNEIKLLWNHDSGEPLASVRGGTMQLIEDERGLKVTAQLPNTTRGRDVAELLRTKVIDSMSFGFNVIKDSWSKDGQTRTLESVRLLETSIVTFPAYPATTAQVRSSQPTINPDELAEALLKLESGEDLDASQADLITNVVNKLRVQEDQESVSDNALELLDLKKKQFDLLLKRI